MLISLLTGNLYKRGLYSNQGSIYFLNLMSFYNVGELGWGQPNVVSLIITRGDKDKIHFMVSQKGRTL